MKIDLHCHTVYSGDSLMTPRDLFRRAREVGLDGVAITEHMSFEASHPAERIAREEGFVLFRGVEVSTDRGHLVLFGLCDDSWNIWGEKHYYDAHKVLERAVSIGAAVIAAHPYSRRDLHAAMDDVLTFAGLTAIEGANGRCRPGENEAAQAAAGMMGLPMTGGSDCHRTDEVGGCYTLFERSVSSVAELIAEIRAGRVTPVQSAGRPLNKAKTHNP